MGGGLWLAPYFFPDKMVNLAPNDSTAVAYFSPFQARKYLPTFTHYLLVITNYATEEVHKCILNVDVDNERYTKVSIPTDNDDPRNGEVELAESGLYTFKIYGQNSQDNLDPDDTSVVGLCEIGVLRVSAESAWATPTFTVPNTVIYYE